MLVVQPPVVDLAARDGGVAVRHEHLGQVGDTGGLELGPSVELDEARRGRVQAARASGGSFGGQWAGCRADPWLDYEGDGGEGFGRGGVSLVIRLARDAPQVGT